MQPHRESAMPMARLNVNECGKELFSNCLSLQAYSFSLIAFNLSSCPNVSETFGVGWHQRRPPPSTINYTHNQPPSDNYILIICPRKKTHISRKNNRFASTRTKNDQTTASNRHAKFTSDRYAIVREFRTRKLLPFGFDWHTKFRSRIYSSSFFFCGCSVLRLFQKYFQAIGTARQRAYRPSSSSSSYHCVAEVVATVATQ